MRKICFILAVLVPFWLVSGCTSFQQRMYDFSISAERGRADLKPGSVEIGGLTMSYLERAGQGETIVLIHGFGANKDNWMRFVRDIPAEYRVVAFDMPGHGDNSKLEDKTYSIDYFADSLARAADALGLSRFHIAGNSMGGYISIVYAARNPQRVITMCLLDNAGLTSLSPQPSDLQLAIMRGQNPLTPASEEEYSTLLEYAFYKKPFIPWPITSVLARQAIASNGFNQKMWNDLNAEPADVSSLLPGIDLPVLVIWGDRDRILHVSTTEILTRLLPDSETIIMKDCGHLPMLERPKETAGYYVSFLKKQQ